MASSDIQPIFGITIFSINIDVIIISVAKLGRQIIEITKVFMVSEFSMQNIQVCRIGIGQFQDRKGVNFVVELFICKEFGILPLSVDDGDGIICEYSVIRSWNVVWG